MNVYIVGTFDTKGKELNFVKERILSSGVSCLTLDVSTKSFESDADIKAEQIFPGVGSKEWKERGEALLEMSEFLKKFFKKQEDIAGVIALGGSGGTSMISEALKSLPIGLPKIMVSTVASGNVRPYMGGSDINLVYSVTDVNGINNISNAVLSNAAHAMVGMVKNKPPHYQSDKLNLGLTMFGVTTPCINQVVEKLEKDYECLVFHATGVGGQSMEKLVDSGYIKGVLDVTTTEICDLLMGGVLNANEDRFDSIIRTRIPYVVSTGALDMVNFGHVSTVPEKYKRRKFYKHNEQVTLMRTTEEENIQMAKWIAAKINQMEGEVRFLIPEKGVSLIDVEGAPFYDPKADAALFQTFEREIHQTPKRKIIKIPCALNESQFSDALVKNFREIML